MTENLTREYYELCRLLGIKPDLGTNYTPPILKKTLTQESLDAVHFLTTGEGAEKLTELYPLDTQPATDDN